MRSEAFGKNLAVPVWDGHILRMLSKMVPERLYVFELLVRREFVKAGRRNSRMRHVKSIAPCAGIKRVCSAEMYAT